MSRAFERKDAAYDGIFFVAVKTTNIFCRPTCRAKPAKTKNLEFFGSAREALRRGYRPCKLCKPMGESIPPVVQKLMNSSPKSERDLKLMGIDPSTARRQFKRHFGTTFAAYQRAQKIGAAVKQVRKGKTMTAAQLEAGYESSSGFRDALSRHFGRAPEVESATLLMAKWLSTPLGPMIAVASDQGIVMLDFADQRGLDVAIHRLRNKFGCLHATPQDHSHLLKLEHQLAEYFAGKRRAFTVPLTPRGTKFELRAWDYLRSIPFGETRSYSQQAKELNNPAAVRAVGRANGHNDIAILIPCHRVIGANGDLTGYAGGLHRKRWLLNHEQQVLGGNLFSH